MMQKVGILSYPGSGSSKLIQHLKSVTGVFIGSEKNNKFQKDAFADIADKYVLTNHVLSFGVDILWRRKVAKMVSPRNPINVLDIATGSGDLALEIQKKCPEAEVIGSDFCEPMLKQARKKRGRLGLDSQQYQFIEGDCLDIPFEDSSFDLVTISFGLRNLADRKKGLAEIYRVLKPNGRLIVLEFTQPYWWFRPFYYFYLRLLLPWFARIVTGDRDAYLYLGTSISNFPNRAELGGELEEVGFENVNIEALTFSIVALHVGTKN